MSIPISLSYLITFMSDTIWMIYIGLLGDPLQISAFSMGFGAVRMIWISIWMGLNWGI